MTRLVVVWGRSGSGKSVALTMLEDLGWYCIENSPAGLMQALVSHSLRSEEPIYRRLAVGLDARNRPDDLASIPALLADLRRSGLRCEVVYLHADDEVLLRRYAETHRRHPLAGADRSLADAIAEERRLLHPLIDSADLVIDTSRMSVSRARRAACRSCSSPSDSSTARRATPTSSSTHGRSPTPTGSPHSSRSPAATRR